MMTSPAAIDGEVFLNYSDVFSDVLTLLDDDPIEHFIVLTYEFDEQQLLNLAALRALEEGKDLGKSGLKLLSGIRPVVFFDARKTKPFGRLPQFLELHPCKTVAFSCHHSKAYCIITRKTVRLAVGSFNLTFTGLFRNREVFESWCWRSAESEDIHLLLEWIKFLKQHYLTEARESSASALAAALATLDKRTSGWERSGARGSRLLASGYDGEKGIDALADCWHEWCPNRHPDHLLAVSPFFDEVPQFGSFAAELRQRFPELSSIEIVTDESVRPNLSRAHFGPVVGLGDSALRLIPEALPEHERQRIERLSGGKTKDLVITRPLHAKILLLSCADGAGLAYLGSANFSRKAWLGENRELGLAWRIDGAANLRNGILAALSVAPENRYSELPPLPPEKPPKADEESVADDTRFPGFIDYIVLVPTEGDGRLVFRVYGDDLARLDGYDISWADMTLRFSCGCSQAFPLEGFRNVLLGGRTIEFRPHGNANISFWVPFQYAGELIAEREALMHSSSWDWLSFYLNPNSGEEDEDPERLPEPGGDITKPLPISPIDVDREANCVIAMQRYLSLFARVEVAFESRLMTVLKIEEATAREQALRTQVIDPLNGLATLLEREATRQAEDRLFKLGELRLLLSSLAKESSPALRAAFGPSIARLDTTMNSAQGQNQISSDYFRFVTQSDCAK